MARQLNTFVNALPIIAKAIGRRYRVKVVIGGDRAYTDGNTIHLPALPADDPEVEALVNGYLDHEAAHCRFTDFGAERSHEPLYNWMENVLEDIRIEDALSRHYPGCQRHLAALTDKLVRDGDETPVTEDADEAGVLSAYMLHRLRFEILGQQAMEPLAAAAARRFEAMFPKGLCTQLTAMMAEVREAKSTQDVCDLARRIAAMLKQVADEPLAPPSSDADPSDGQGEDQDETSQSGPARNEADEPRSASTGESGNDGDQDEASDQARREALRQALQADKTDLAEAQSEKVAEKLAAQVADQPDIAEADDEDGSGAAGGGQSVLALGEPPDESRVRQASARLRARLAGLIQAERLSQRWAKRLGVRVDNRALPRLALANTRVFAARAEEPGVDTAVTLLIDRSGSMHGDEIRIAREAALAVAYALDEIEGVNPSVFAFPGGGGNEGRVATLHRRGRRVDARQFGISAGGSTPLTEAAWFAGLELMSAPEPRKILIVLTDGVPNEPNMAKDVLERMRGDGIETLGIGIQTTISPGLIPDNRQINDVAELPQTLFELLEQKLVAPAAA